MTRLAARIDGARESAANSRAGREKARKAIARLRESLGALEASLDAAPAVKRKPRRSKKAAARRQRPAVMSEAELNARWARLDDARRARAALKAKAAAAAADARERDGVKLRAACEAAAQGTEWSAATVLDWYYGKGGAAGLADYPRHLWPLAIAPKHLGGTAEAECDPAAVTLAREGPEALARRRPAQIRERPQRAMEAVNADGHEIDVFVRWPGAAKPVRPTLVAWQDIHSGKILSWRIDRTENADGYRLSFADLLRGYGIPQHVFVDNGRAIAAKGLTGGKANRYKFKVKRDDPVGLLTQLMGQENIHWTTPYHSQSKPIERAFRDLATDIAKDHRLRGAYTGNKPDAKPENYGSKAAPLEKFLEVMADGVKRHNARRGRRGLGLEGRSFDEAFRESYEKHAAGIPKPTEAQLSRWLLGAKGIRAHKTSGAVELFGTRYWSERLSEKLAGRSAEKRQVVVRFDPDRLGRPVTVETLDGKLIGKAEPQGAVKFIDTQAARGQARDQARLRRNAREQLEIHRRMGAREYDRLLGAADAEEKGAEEAPARSKVVAGVFGKEPARARPAPAAREMGMADREFGPANRPCRSGWPASTAATGTRPRGASGRGSRRVPSGP